MTPLGDRKSRKSVRCFITQANKASWTAGLYQSGNQSTSAVGNFGLIVSTKTTRFGVHSDLQALQSAQLLWSAGLWAKAELVSSRRRIEEGVLAK